MYRKLLETAEEVFFSAVFSTFFLFRSPL